MLPQLAALDHGRSDPPAGSPVKACLHDRPDVSPHNVGRIRPSSHDFGESNIAQNEISREMHRLVQVVLPLLAFAPRNRRYFRVQSRPFCLQLPPFHFYSNGFVAGFRYAP
jgi:hypothetical protein